MSVADIVQVVDRLRADLRQVAVGAGAWADPLVRHHVASLVEALEWSLGEAASGGDAVVTEVLRAHANQLQQFAASRGGTVRLTMAVNRGIGVHLSYGQAVLRDAPVASRRVRVVLRNDK